MDLNQTTVSSLAATLRTTPEVLTKFLTEAEASEEVKPFAATLGGLQVFTESDFNTRLTNERQIAATEATRTATGNTYGAIDSRILKATGIAKAADESTADYSERAYKEKFGKNGGDESEELKRLRSDITAKDQLLQQKDTELQKMVAEHATEAKQARINSGLDAAINALPINAEAKFLDAHRRLVKSELMQAYDVDVVDGKTIFKDKKTGKEMRNATTADYMTEAELVTLFAPNVVSLKATSAAQPSGFKPGAPSTDASGASVIDYSQFNSRDELNTYLKRYGISPTGKEGGVHLNKFKAARPELFK